jgi:spastin
MTRKFNSRSPLRSVSENLGIRSNKSSVDQAWQGSRSFPSTGDSVHQKNLYIASRPVVLVFEYLGLALYKFFVLLQIAALTVWKPIAFVWKCCRGEFVRSGVVSLAENKVALGECGKFSLKYLPGKSEVSKSTIFRDPSSTMSANGASQGPGLTDPLLARQKQHHRKAFDCISKALRIDEDSKG